MSGEEENKQFKDENKRFGLPEDYFQKSARSVFNKVEWLEEHKELPVLASLQNKKVFSVPGHYFALGEQRLELLNCPGLLALKKEQVFIVPNGYFEELEVVLLSKAVSSEEAVLDGIPKQNPFGVKNSYFQENEARLHNLLLKKQKRPAKIIRLFGAKAWMAAAAILVTVLGVWIYNIYTTVPPDTKDCGTIACLDKQDLLKSKSLESLETEELYDLVNSKKLEKKLESDTKKPDKKAGDSLDDAALDLLDEI